MSTSAQPWHVIAADQVLADLGSNRERGLSAAAVAQRLASFGPNALTEKQRSGLPALLVAQFRDLLIRILLVAAIIAALVGEPADAMVILVIICLNALIGVVQQYRAESAIAALRHMATPHARALRDGHYCTVPADQLVPGDIAILEAGAVVPADLRLLQAEQLQVDESLLTGESSPAEKDSASLQRVELGVGDRCNMAYRGTTVTRGRGLGVVVATGAATEIGGIAELLGGITLPESPLQQRLATFSQRLAGLILGICLLIFLAGLARGEPWLLMLLTAVSLAVAAIPEALPAVISISLAMGAHRMSRQKALVRSLPAVETLGSVSFICCDKTGTLTLNRMHAEHILTTAGELPAAEFGKGTAPLQRLLGRCLALSNDVRLDGDGAASGDPTEVALFELAASAGFDKAQLECELPRVAEIAFTSERKLMTTAHRDGDTVVVFTKGAAEILIESCTQALGDVGPAPIDRGYWRAAVEQLSEQGYRVLGLASGEVARLPQEQLSELERELTLLGLVALIDPPRPGALEAVRECAGAGITTVMITGDHPGTALAIARRLDIAREGEQVVTGEQLDTLDDADLVDAVTANRVYARVSPAQKIRLVQALQSRGQCVAMTGDGVNDAPALRQANIGVAMGLRGTDVARQAAAMILLDDNFTTIVNAVREGRRIFDNIRKFVKYTMTSNAGEIWTLALAPLLGMPLPLLPIHILWINLVTDGLPGLALTIQPHEGHIMQRPPRPPREGLFTGDMWQYILWLGLLIGAVSLGVQAWALQQGLANWQTMVFTVLTFSQLANVMVLRNERESLFTSGLLQNPALLGAVLLTVLLQLAIVYLPALNAVFHTAPLTGAELGVCLALPLLIVAAVETQKWQARRRAMRR
ncbi:MAG: cation-translocating P-type ATPase [Halieaceae bacterium]|nr:cation-translocating P-type ATPase [Halieaceae bacterium]